MSKICAYARDLKVRGYQKNNRLARTVPRGRDPLTDDPSEPLDGFVTPITLPGDRTAVWLVAIGAWAVLVLAVLPPYLGPAGRSILMQAFSFACHQMPSRSPHIDGVPFAVCDRCLGLYAGIASGVLVGLFLAGTRRFVHRNAGFAIVAALIPVGSDWMFDIVGVWANTPATRVSTGGAFGLTMGVLLVAAAWPRRAMRRIAL